MSLITEEEKQSRAQIVKESIYSVELEGLIVPQGQLDIFYEYINGTISMAEAIEQTKAKYGYTSLTTDELDCSEPPIAVTKKKNLTSCK